MTKQEAVNLYGSEECKEHFRKYGKFKNKTIENALIKTLKQYYTSVKPFKIGKQFVYKLGPKREMPIQRDDKRKTNGAWSNPYTKNLDVYILQALENKHFEEAYASSGLAEQLGIINHRTYELLGGRFDDNVFSKSLNSLVDNGVLQTDDNKILMDYLDMLGKVIGHIVYSTERLERANLISRSIHYMGHTQDGENIEIGYKDYTQLENTRKRLMKNHGVKPIEINRYKNKENVKKFSDEWKDVLKHFPIGKNRESCLEYYYKTYLINLNGENGKVLNYLQVYDNDLLKRYSKNENDFLEENKSDLYENIHSAIIAISHNKKKLAIDSLESILNKKDNTILELEAMGFDYSDLFEKKNEQTKEKFWGRYLLKENYTIKISNLHNYFFNEN